MEIHVKIFINYYRQRLSPTSPRRDDYTIHLKWLAQASIYNIRYESS